jgi:hypothetical protein
MRGRVTFEFMNTFTLYVWLYAGMRVGRTGMVHLVERDAEIGPCGNSPLLPDRPSPHCSGTSYQTGWRIGVATNQGGQTMEMKHWLSAVVSCLALALWAMPAAAAPISGVTTGPKVAVDGSSIVATTHWRRRYAYYYSENSSDDFDRYYPYDEPYYRYSYLYPSYHNYYAYPRYGYHRYHHRHYRDHRRW